MKHLLLLSAFLFAQLTFAQSEQGDLSLTIGVTTIPAFNKHKIGLDFSVRHYLTDAFSGGINFNTVSPKYNHGFGYNTDRTLINMYNISIPFQYDVINTEKLSLGFGLSNGILLNVLRNRNEPREENDFNPDLGTHIPRRLKTESYFTLTPYVDLSYPLVALDAKETTFIFVTSKVGYRNVFGNGSFSKSNDFSNYTISLGITIK